jgi:protocatechuate 3,4-dioxygenase, alpha subunit
MSTANRLRAASQTVGPFFHKGLKWRDSTLMTTAASGRSTTLFGSVQDGNGEPVADALLEFFAPPLMVGTNSLHRPHGFARCATDTSGVYRLHFILQPDRPTTHFEVVIFARGLLTSLQSRVYLVDAQSAQAVDSTLSGLLEPERANTLIATPQNGAFKWNIVLQGENETVFFERE